MALVRRPAPDLRHGLSIVIEALIRGYVDTGAYGSARTWPAPGGLAGRINSRYELAFEVVGEGTVDACGLMIWSDGIVPHIVIPVRFVVSAGCYPVSSRNGRPAATARTTRRTAGHGRSLKYLAAAPVSAGHRRA